MYDQGGTERNQNEFYQKYFVFEDLMQIKGNTNCVILFGMLFPDKSDS